MTKIKTHAILIGGLILNDKPLQKLFDLFSTVEFIDINQFTFTEVRQYTLNLVKNSQSQVTLIGYSTGGLVALKIYKQLEKCVKLILINFLPFFMQDNDWNGINYTNYQRLAHKLNTLTLPQFNDHFVCLSLFPHISKSDERLTFISQYAHTNMIAYWLDILLKTDLRKEFNNITTPVLMLFSEHDSIVPSTNSFTNVCINKTIITNSTHAYLNAHEIHKYITKFLYSDRSITK